jgi:hypothetical protein
VPPVAPTGAAELPGRSASRPSSGIAPGTVAFLAGSAILFVSSFFAWQVIAGERAWIAVADAMRGWLQAATGVDFGVDGIVAMTVGVAMAGVLMASRKRCPDCAERAALSAKVCPRCRHAFGGAHAPRGR